MVLITILRKRDSSTYYFRFLKLATLWLPKHLFASELLRQHVAHWLADLFLCMHVTCRNDTGYITYHMGQHPYLPLKVLNIFECFPEEKKRISIN